MQKYQYFEWGLTLNLDRFKVIIFQNIICEPFRFEKRDLQNSMRNLAKIQMSPKHVLPTLLFIRILRRVLTASVRSMLLEHNLEYYSKSNMLQKHI